MSDLSQGEGWWRASDGKWYPPEQHPEYSQRELPQLRTRPSRPASGRAAGRKLSWKDKFWWALTLPFGLTTWAAFLYAGSRTGRLGLKRAAGAYGAAILVGILLAAIAHTGALNDIAGALFLVTWVIGMVHAALIRTSVNRQLALLDTSAVQQAEKELDRREYGRQLLKANPALARQVGVGRPDVSGSDSFGLIDVNHAGQAGLMMLPGLSEEQVQKVLQYRNSGGFFVSAEDLAMYLDLPQTAIGALQDTAVFDMGTS
jgi:DNA uptake protein ComE-like DNA-binding protein